MISWMVKVDTDPYTKSGIVANFNKRNINETDSLFINVTVHGRSPTFVEMLRLFSNWKTSANKTYATNAYSSTGSVNIVFMKRVNSSSSFEIVCTSTLSKYL